MIGALLAFAAVAGIAIAGAAVVQGRSTAPDEPVPLSGLADAPIRPLQGQATPAAWQVIRGAESDRGSRYVVIALRAADCFTCEDLGRQLRELQHARTPEQSAALKLEYTRIGYRAGEHWPAPARQHTPDELLALLRSVETGAGLQGYLEVLRSRNR
jgi:hypothetical protein